MTALAHLPGLRFAVAAPLRDASPIRSDVAGFMGQFRRGPLGRAVRVEGWRELCAVYGGLRRDVSAAYAVRGYFENEGEVAHVVRLAGVGANSASAAWTITGLPVSSGFASAGYRIRATSEGVWANDLLVELAYRRDGRDGRPEVDVVVRCAGEPTELHARIEPALITELVSPLIAIEIDPLAPPLPVSPLPGPRHAAWSVTLANGVDAAPSRIEYLRAIELLGDVPEVALVALPDLHDVLGSDVDRYEVLAVALRQAKDLHDRLVIIDVPERDAGEAIEWVTDLRSFADDDTHRAGAVYHPVLRVNDPLGGFAAPQRRLASSGHVAGVISKLDRERGAHHSPANAPVIDAVDVDLLYDDADLERLTLAGIDPVICRCGRGLQIWGARTLDLVHPSHRFVAHRRLVHRLVRVIRRVAEPLVFDTNGPELWLAIVRAITTVLLDAYRAGALKGHRPEDAFRVRCDETTNPVEERDLGRCLCEIEIAPAVPMEFITLRIALSTDGRLEVT
ncbi:MAG: phage tail sheath subtilisin-like domain-containing protein [Kofleriaceae bacterium]